MDNGISTAIEIGQRLRRYRNLVGMSQQKLSDQLGTSPQNISKYEKEGLHDIEIIQRLSTILGYDLLTDERDEEGEIGEVGQEILMILVKQFGYCSAEKLLDGERLFGLSRDNVLRELTKLQRLGMIVREQYKDFSGRNYDQVFITAKGIIGLKHLGVNKKTKRFIKKSKTYEMICGEYASYQDYVDANPLQRSIRKLKFVSGFRKPFIDYIHDHYEIGLEAGWFYELLAPSEPNAYINIMFSMIFGKTRVDEDQFAQHVLENTFFASPEIEMEHRNLREELHISDAVEKDFLEYLDDCTPYSFDDFTETWNPGERFLNDQVDKEAYGVKYRRFQELQDNEDKEFEDAFSFDLNDALERFIEEKGDSCPINWFTKSDIESFVTNNILPPATEEERQVEELIQYILDGQPEIAKNYFVFPHEWERNGLANLVRERYGVTRFFN